MRALNRNKQKFYYCLYKGQMSLSDNIGYQTGEERITYEEPVEMWGNVGPATGYAQLQSFGNLEDYDKVIVLANPNVAIDESTVLFIDKKPEFKTEKVTVWEDGEDEYGNPSKVPMEVEVQEPLYDYTVRRVARSLNAVSIAVSKVKVS